MTTEEAKSTDPRNINTPARVIFAQETTPSSGIHCPAGFVLPGGRRTECRFEAMAVAVRMAAMTRG
jgi:hypothetical protein